MYSIQNNIGVQVKMRSHVTLTCSYFFLRRAGLGGCLNRTTRGLDGAVVRLVLFLPEPVSLPDSFPFVTMLALPLLVKQLSRIIIHLPQQPT